MCNSRYMLFRFSVSWTLLKILTLCKQQMHLLFCFRLIRIFGFAEDTHAQQNLNKFSFVFDLFVSLHLCKDKQNTSNKKQVLLRLACTLLIKTEI